jgi:hypothetical protein
LDNPAPLESEEPEPSRGSLQSSAPRSPITVPRASEGGDLQALPAALKQMQADHGELVSRIDSLEGEVRRLKGLVDDLVRDLRG